MGEEIVVTAEGEAVDGKAVDGKAVDGKAVDGKAVDGKAVDGKAVDGKEVDGNAAVTAGAEPGTGRSLSPSRAGDFLTCPLLYRFRVIDRLPEPPSPAAARGPLVHAVLEHLFDEPAAGRTPEAARSLLAPEWDRLAAQEPELAGLFESDA